MSTLAVVVDWSDGGDRVDGVDRAAGAAGTGGSARLARARRMVERLADRAPDGTAAVEAPGAALGFGKLVVSRKQGHAEQPLVDPAAGLTLVADVRVDNRDELRGPLGLPATATDAEIVLAGYRRWGPLVPDHLVGDFAFAVWDARARRLFAARDPFGVRPLVYRRLPDGTLLLASDVESILAVDPTAWKIDDVAVVDHLLAQWRFSERTFWEPIKAVPAGHCLQASARSLDVVRWWRPPTDPEIIADHETCYREFRRRFRQAVADRLASDHPVLIHLSGGFDSSSIAVMAGDIAAPVPLRAAGAIYPGLLCDESLYMAATAARLPYPTEYWNGTHPLAIDLDEPSLTAPGHRTCANDGTRGDFEIAGREGARVVLSGVGGDVWQPCNESQMDYLRRGQWRQLGQAAFLRPGMSWRSRARVLRWSVGLETPETLRSLVRRLRRVHRPEPPWLASPVPPGPIEPPLAAHPLARSAGLAQARRLAELEGPRPVHAVERMQAVAQAGGVEMRFPFLDVRLLDLLWRMPLTIWGPPGYPSRFHPRAMGDLLPVEVATRRWKTDFSEALAARAVLARRALGSGADSGGHALLERYCKKDALSSLLHGDVLRSPLGPEGWNRIWRVAVLEAWLAMVYGQGLTRLTSRGNMETGPNATDDELNRSRPAPVSVPYEPPAVVALGNVHELLAGVGSRTHDAITDTPSCGDSGGRFDNVQMGCS
jgi:asparagine synthase (glutamine-hydrolysing)